MRVLVVDDDEATLKVIKALVEPLGLEVLALADSREAAQRVNTDKFDGVFVDTKMPFLDGFALAQSIRASAANARVPIVMLTGLSDAETMRRGFKAGVTFFLSKPVNLERLHSLVKVMHGPMLRERRRYARLPFRAVVNCRLGAKQFKTESVNISEGGILLAASGGAIVGDELDLEFALAAQTHSVRVRARVIRKEAPDRTATMFLNLDAPDQQAIRDYITGRIKS